MPRASNWGGIFNVKDDWGGLGGAKGDGVTDDRAAIQAAYTACLAAKGVLYFPSGDYLVKQLGVSSYALNFNGALVNVEGVGHGSRILGDGGDYRLLIVTAGGGSTQRTRIQGLYFDGGSVGAFAAENNNTGIHIQKCSVECKITDCTFENLNEDGIYLGGDATDVMADVIVAHNVFRNIGRTGVALISVNRFNVSDNILEDINFQGIDVEPSANTYSAMNGVIANNVIQNSGSSTYPSMRAAIGVVHQNGSAEAVTGKIGVTGNTISNYGQASGQSCYGIMAYQQHAVTIAGNTIDYVRNAASYLYHATDMTVNGNTCTRSPVGILLDTSTDCNIGGNIASSGTGAGSAGIFIGINSVRNSVVGNRCHLNAGWGIYNAGNGNIIEDNACYGNNTYGIQNDGANDCEINNNRCEANGQALDDTYDNIRVKGNYNNVQGNLCRKGALANFAHYGLHIESGTKNKVTNNDLYLSCKTGGNEFHDAGTTTDTTAANRTA